MSSAPSFDDFANLGKAEAILKKPLLGLRVGDISEMIISGAAAIADRLIGWFAERIAATFLDGAQGDDLTLLAADHWAIQRRDATKAIATVTFTRAGADATAQNIPIGSTVATTKDSQGNDVQYVTTALASWGISVNGTQTVAVQAVDTGLDPNLSASGLITRLISSPPPGGAYTITASTQPAGGSDAESDPDLRDRVRNYPATLRRGTLSALEYGAKTLTAIAVAKASAIQDTSGIVTVFVSDASGNSTGTTKTVSPLLVDDGSMTAKVAIELYNWACAGAFVEVTGGAVQTVNISVAIAVKLGVDIQQLITDIQNSISARVGKLNIGATLFLSDIISAVKAVDPDNIVNITMLNPAVDTVPSTPGNIIRPGSISVS